jgi:hypothetical protein
MTTERDRDVLERLRTCNPVPTGLLDDLVWTDTAQALFHRIVATPTSAPARTRGRLAPVPPRPEPGRRRRPRLAVLVGVVSMSVAVGAYALVARTSSKPQNVACFASADLGARTAVVGVDAKGPVAACASVWDKGFLGETPPASLRACLLESGVVGVFPQAAGRDVCLDLGLASASSPATPTPDRVNPPGSAPVPDRPGPGSDDPIVDPTTFFAFRDAVLSRFLGQGCIGADAGEIIVREELDRAGLDGWTITRGVGADGAGFSAGRPCASLNFHPEVWSVDLVPVPPAG